MQFKNIITILLIFISFSIYSQNEKEYTTYIVKQGESLRSIAKTVGCKYREIKDLNPDVDKKHPKVNTTLVVPNKNFKKEVIAPKVKEPQKKAIVHTVKKGETFYRIARHYNVTIQSLKDANSHTLNGLQPGMKIRIPFKEEFTEQPKKLNAVLYKVKKGDTKWRIAKKHQLTVAELERMNPGIKDGLKEGQNIIVKATEEEVTPEIELPINKPEENLFVYHKVKQGEGLFRIAVIYDTTQEKIKELNPEATKKLRPGMLLKIPAKKKDKFLTHVVTKGDTFYNLTRKYEISKETLVSLNPELKEGLKLGMVLKIKVLMSDPTIDEISIKISSKTTTPSNALIDSIPYLNTVHLSFLMPLKSDKKIDYSQEKKSKLRTICTDFYMGAEIAIDSLKKQGLNIITHVYDTHNDPSELYNILKNEDIKNSQALIGPFFFKNAQLAAQYIPNTPIVTPLYSKKQTQDKTPNIIKSAVDKKDLTSSLINYLKNNYNNQKINIITDTTYTNIAKANSIKLALLQHDSISDIKIIKPQHNKRKHAEIYMDKEMLQAGINEKTPTWVILVSNNRIVVSDVVNTYGVLAIHNNVRLFTPTTFNDFGYLDYHFLGALNWTFPVTQFHQLESDSIETFNKKYYEKNFSEPSIDSYTGFDLTYDTLVRLAMANNLYEGLNLGISNRIAHKFNYQKIDDKVYVNKGVLIIGFDKNLNYKILN